MNKTHKVFACQRPPDDDPLAYGYDEQDIALAIDKQLNSNIEKSTKNKGETMNQRKVIKEEFIIKDVNITKELKDMLNKLSIDGVNSKKQVADQIEKILNKLNGGK